MALTPEEEAAIQILPNDPIDQAIADELAYLTPQPLTPAEEAQIQIDQPTLTPEEAAQIEINPPDLGGAIASPSQVPDTGVTSPSQVEAGQPNAPQSTRVGGKLQVSQSGFGPDRGQAGIWAQGYEQFAENDARLRANSEASQLETAVGYNNLLKAQEDKAAVEAWHYDEMSKLLRDKEDFIRKSAELDQVMYEQARVESQAHLDAAMQQFAAVRQMAVQSPLGQLDGWQFAGAALAAAAQGFLAAQGIKIDVIGQINRWEEMSIREQERRIAQAEHGAEDQLNLWKISKETSRDDLEARLRYRGMMLEQLSVAVDTQAMRFNSQLAQSNAQVTNAQLSLERNNILRQIRDNYEKERLANLSAMRDEAHKRVMERMEQRRLDIEAARAQAELNRSKVTKPGPQPIPIQDTRNVKRDDKGNILLGPDGKPATGGQYVAFIDPNMPDGIQSKAWETVSNAQQLHDNLQTGLDSLRQLYVQLDKENGPGWWRKKTDEAYIRFDAQRNRVVGDVQRFMTGLAATEPEAQRWLSQLKDDGWLQTGANRQPKLINDLGNWGRGRFENALKIPGVKVIPQSQRWYGEPLGTIDPATEALSNAQDMPRQPSRVEHLGGAASAKTEYVDQKPSRFYQETHPQPTIVQTYGQSMERRQKNGRVESWATQLEDAARAYINPAEYVKSHRTGYEITAEAASGKKQTEDDLNTIQGQAIDIIAAIANGSPLNAGDPVPPPDRQAYARKLLDAIQKDPQALYEALSE